MGNKTLISLQPHPLGKRKKHRSLAFYRDDETGEIEVRTRCYAPANVQWYEDDNGELQPIDLNLRHTRANGDIIQRGNHRTHGFRCGKDGQSFFGIRPDYDQSGKIQFVWSPVGAEVNGQAFNVDSSDNPEKLSAIFTRLGKWNFRTYRQGANVGLALPQAWDPANARDFSVEFELRTRGLQIENGNYPGPTTLKKAQAPDMVSVGSVTGQEFVAQVLQSTPTIPTFYAAFINDKHLFQSSGVGSCPAWQGVPPGYTSAASNLPACSHLSGEGMVVIVIRRTDGYHPEVIEEMAVSVAEEVLGGTRADGQFHIRNAQGDIIGQTHWDESKENYWIAVLKTDRSHLPGDFAGYPAGYVMEDVVRYTDKTATQLIADFQASFQARFTAISQVDVDSNYVEPNAAGLFVFTDPDSDEDVFLVVRSPKLLDADFNVVTDRLIHTLRIVDYDPATDTTTWQYKKIASQDWATGSVSASGAAYLDGDIYYAATSDGTVTNEISKGTWDETHDDTDADRYDSTSTNNTIAAFDDGDFLIRRWFGWFDTSGVSGGTPASADFKMYVQAVTNNATLCAAKHTAVSPLSTDDFDDVGTYWDTYAVTGTGWMTFTITPGDINLSGDTKVGVRNYTYDYLDVEPGGTDNSIRIRNADYSGTTYDPYLEITEAAGGGATPPVMQSYGQHMGQGYFQNG